MVWNSSHEVFNAVDSAIGYVVIKLTLQRLFSLRIAPALPDAGQAGRLQAHLQMVSDIVMVFQSMHEGQTG